MNKADPSNRNLETLVNNDRRMLDVLMDNLPGMVYRCANSANWEMLFASAGCRALTGYAPEELVNNACVSFGELIHPEDRRMVNDVIQAAVNVGRPYQLEYRLLHRSLGLRWVWEQGRGVFTAAGELAFLEGYIADITERKTAQEDLKHSEAQFRLLAENARDVIFRVEFHPQLRLVYVSPAALALSGYTAEEHYQQPHLMERMIHPQDRAMLEKLVAGGEIPDAPILVRWQRKDGRWIWTEQHNVLLRDETGRVVAAEGVIRDISQRMEVEAALQRKVAEEAAIAAMSGAILDPQATIEQVAEIVLRHTLALTGSAHGFVASKDPDNGALIAHTLTAMMETECKITGADRRIIFRPQSGGGYAALWGHALNTRRPFYTHAPAEHPAAAGLPAGHIGLHNFLTAPVLNGEVILGQIAVANKAGGEYGDEDLQIVQRLAGLYGLYLQQWLLRERLQANARQLRRHNRVLGVVAETASRFLRALDWDYEMEAMLAGLGQALDATQAFIFQNYALDGGELAPHRAYRWMADRSKEAAQPSMEGFSYETLGLARWVDLLSRGKAIAGQVQDLPLNEQALIGRQGIKSVLAMPIFTGYDWVGFLGFGSEDQARDWCAPELDALQAAAGILGAAIERRQAEETLRLRTGELERFERLVVGRELKMIELKQRIQTLEAELHGAQTAKKD